MSIRQYRTGRIDGDANHGLTGRLLCVYQPRQSEGQCDDQQNCEHYFTALPSARNWANLMSGDKSECSMASLVSGR